MSKLRENKVEKNAQNLEFLNLTKHQNDLSFFSNNKRLFCFTVSVSQECGGSLSWWFGPRVSHLTAIKMSNAIKIPFQGGSFYRIDQMMLVVDRRPQFFPRGPLHRAT